MKPIPQFFRCLLFAVLLPWGPSAARAVDRDGNGLNDVWEAAYGMARLPAADDDGDGQRNLVESEAGTDPADPVSVHHVQSLSTDGSSVHLEWPTVPGKHYQIEVSASLTSAQWQTAGTARMGAGGIMTADLPLATTFLTGGAEHRVWRNLTSSNLSTVKSFVSAGTPAPSETKVISRLETPRDEDDNYAQYIRGWIVPPSTGIYSFWIASDDSSELSLSSSASAASKSVIASVNGYTNPAQWTKFSTQHSAPVTLQANTAYYFEACHAEGAGGDHLTIAWDGPGFSREILTEPYLANSPDSLAQLSGATGGSLFFRVTASDADADGDGVTDYEEMLAGLNPQTGTTTPRVADMTALFGILNAESIVTIGTSEARAYEASQSPARFVIHRSGGIQPLTIAYSVGGTAASGADYPALSGSVTLGPAQRDATIEIHPVADAELETAETVTATLLPGAGYRVGSPASATVSIDDAEDVLYVATLRGSTDPAERSGGYGSAVLRVAGNKVFATLGLNFGNLNAAQTGTEIFLSPTGAGGDVVLTLPPGQITGQRWNFEMTATQSTAQILAALQANQLRVRLTSTAFPGGEISGTFQLNPGWQNMPTPPDVPVPPETQPGGTVTAEQAARFLTQATFGPTSASIAQLTTQGIPAWLDAQLAMPATPHLPGMRARRQQFIDRTGGADEGWQSPRHETWWQRSLTAPDQLRQRMAFALSEIFVISQNGVLDGSHEGVTAWQDMLLESAFGSYRALLEKVTLSPIMGQYLSMVRNRKPDPQTGAEPDENYAREVMQLFSIGLSRLHPDGSLQLDDRGMPMPTYAQSDIVGLAHVFTGWSYGYPGPTVPNFFYGPRDEMLPMVQYPGYHDTAEKRLIDGHIVPAGQTGEQDLAEALDLLANHPNVPPFLARQLIQRFVTSNPSPGYIFRVASAFSASGGNLGAALRAVLVDHEARDATIAARLTFGKLREPVIRYAHLLRAMKAQPIPAASPVPGEPWYFLNMQYSFTQQAALQAPSVFNFFQPGYVPPGPIAAAGLYAPEFQIASETTSVNQANEEFNTIYYGRWTPEKNPETNTNYGINPDYSQEIALLIDPAYTLAQNQERLLDLLNLKLLSGQMTPALRQGIRDAWATLPSWFATTHPDHRTGRIKMAVYLIFASPEYAIQK